MRALAWLVLFPHRGKGARGVVETLRTAKDFSDLGPAVKRERGLELLRSRTSVKRLVALARRPEAGEAVRAGMHALALLFLSNHDSHSSSLANAPAAGEP
jgi:hypothetical protein